MASCDTCFFKYPIYNLINPNKMYIAYSALRTQQKNGKNQLINKELTERHEAYQAACNKYRNEIAAIQKYMPGWMPPLKLKA